MIASLCLVSALLVAQGGQQPAQPSGAVLSTQRSGVLREARENITDAKGNLVAARVEYYLVTTTRVVDDNKIPVKTVRTRPESPARAFSLVPEMIAAPKAVDNDDALDQTFRVAQMEDVAEVIGPELFKGIQKGREAVQNILKNTRPQEVNPNENLQRGGWTTREYGMQEQRISTQLELVKRIFIPGQAEPTEEKQWLGVQSQGTIRVPAADPLIRSTFAPDDKPNDLKNSIGGIQFTPENAELAGLGYVSLPRLNPMVNYFQEGFPVGSTVNYLRDATRHIPAKNLNDAYLATGYQPKDLMTYIDGMAAQGDSMNALQIPGNLQMDWPDCGSEMHFPSGTTWIPGTAGYQAMTNYQPIRLRMTFVQAGVGIEMLQVPTATGRTHCLSMNLKEPAPGVKYYPYMPADETITDLAKLAEKSLFRGPWDQARTWIYTNKASLDEINKIISPGVTTGQYVNNLRDIASVAGFNKTDLQNKKLFDPKLLASPSASNEAFGWFASHVAETSPRETAAWLKSAPAEIVTLITSPRDGLDTNHPIRLLQAMLNSSQVEVRRAALEMLEKTKGKDDRLKGKLGSFALNLHSTDRQEADLAKKAAERLAG